MNIGLTVETRWTRWVSLSRDHLVPFVPQEEKERKELEEARKKQDEDAKKKKALTNMTQQYGGVQQRVSQHTRTHMQTVD